MATINEADLARLAQKICLCFGTDGNLKNLSEAKKILEQCRTPTEMAAVMKRVSKMIAEAKAKDAPAVSPDSAPGPTLK